MFLEIEQPASSGVSHQLEGDASVTHPLSTTLQATQGEHAGALLLRLFDRTGPFAAGQRDFLKTAVRPLKLPDLIDENNKRVGLVGEPTKPVPARPCRCSFAPTIRCH